MKKTTASSNSHVVNTFLRLVQIDSPTGYEQNMAQEVNKILKTYGLKSEIDKQGNVIGFLPGNKNLESYLLNAHLDTIEPGRGIKPKIVNGWIVSSGDTILGADNKAGLAAILEAVKRLILTSPEERHPLEIIFTTSEESGNWGAVKLNYSKLKSKTGYSLDLCSKNLGEMVVSAPFYNRIDIEIIGKSEHTKDPEKGLNVLPIFASAVNKIKLGRISKNTLANIGIVKIGGAVNAIPGSAILAGEVRSTVEKELEETTKNIIKVFRDSSVKYKAKLKFKVTRENGGYKFGRNDEFIKRTVKLIESFGLKSKLIDSFGCADANIFAEHNIKVLCLSDGSTGAHSMNETIKISSLEKLVDLVCKLVEK